MDENLKILGLRKITNGYLDSGDVYYEDLESALNTGILGFCGCGDPLSVIRYVSGALQIVLKFEKNRNDFRDNEKLEETDTPDYFDLFEQECFQYFHEHKGADYFMWYVLDKSNLTNHGGHVPGWLLDRGKAFIELEKSIPIQEYETEM
jgi:hypothetical protein